MSSRMVNSNDDFIGAYLTMGAKEGLNLIEAFWRPLLYLLQAWLLGQAFEPVPRLIPLLLSTDLSSCRLARKKRKSSLLSSSVFDFDIGFEFILKRFSFLFLVVKIFDSFQFSENVHFWKSFEKAPKHQKIGFTLILGFRSKFCGNRNFKRGRCEIRTCSAQKMTSLLSTVDTTYGQAF